MTLSKEYLKMRFRKSVASILYENNHLLIDVNTYRSCLDICDIEYDDSVFSPKICCICSNCKTSLLCLGCIMNGRFVYVCCEDNTMTCNGSEVFYKNCGLQHTVSEHKNEKLLTIIKNI
jgi:hypothetical protein